MISVCDWYQATFQRPGDLFLPELADLFHAEVQELPKGHNGYSRAAELVRERERICTMDYGGSNLWPNVVATGYRGREFCARVRAAHLDHRVTRVDSAIDLSGPGLFDRVAALAISIARAPHWGGRTITINQQGNWFESKGRTLYLGSPRAACRVRIYEKGYEQRDVHGVMNADLDWTRVEMQYRPQKLPARVAASSLTMDEVWGCSRWTRDLFQRLTSSEVQLVDRQERSEASSLDRKMKYLAAQWGNTLAAYSAQYGEVALQAFISRTVSNAEEGRSPWNG